MACKKHKFSVDTVGLVGHCNTANPLRTTCACCMTLRTTCAHCTAVALVVRLDALSVSALHDPVVISACCIRPCYSTALNVSSNAQITVVDQFRLVRAAVEPSYLLVQLHDSYGIFLRVMPTPADHLLCMSLLLLLCLVLLRPVRRLWWLPLRRRRQRLRQLRQL